MRVAVMNPEEEIKVIEIGPDERGSFLNELQKLVGGLIEPVDVLYGDKPLLWVNDNGIAEGLFPNRAIFANERMAERGYLSQINGRDPVKRGELYAILLGPIVACSYGRNAEGEYTMRDISDDELKRLADDFWNTHSGIEEVMKIRLRNMLGNAQAE